METATHLLAKAESPPYFFRQNGGHAAHGHGCQYHGNTGHKALRAAEPAAQQHRRRDKPQPDEAVEEAVLIPEFAHPAAADDGTDQDHGNTHVAIAQALDGAAQKPGGGHQHHAHHDRRDAERGG